MGGPRCARLPSATSTLNVHIRRPLQDAEHGRCPRPVPLVVSAEGRVWTFGYGYRGSLGHNDEQDRLVPTLLATEVFKGSGGDGVVVTE